VVPEQGPEAQLAELLRQEMFLAPHPLKHRYWIRRRR
jgi:hypothetical protein